MIIDLKAVDRSPRHFDLVFRSDWWQPEDESSQIIGLNGTLKCRLDVARAGVKFIMNGSLSGSLMIRCDRCLEAFGRDLEYSFRLFLSAHLSESGEYEYELAEDDMNFHFVDGSEVDLDDIIREQIYMALPVKCLCREDCRGLCSICGANLNVDACKCKRSDGHSGFAKLINFKIASPTED